MISKRDAPSYSVKISIPGGPTTLLDKTDRVIAFTFDDDESKADKLELDLDNFDLSLFDDPHWIHGNQLVVSWGYVGNMSKPRTMHIGKITGSKALKIEALAPSILMNKYATSHTWEHMKLSEIAKAIAAQYGLDFASSAYGTYLASDVLGAQQDAGPPSIQQAKMTDAQFLAHLAKRNGFLFCVKADGLHFEPRDFGGATKRVFRYYTDPGQGDILDFTLENDVTMAPGAVHAVGRDPKERKDIHETAGNTETPRPGLAPGLHTISIRDGTSKTVAIAQDAVIATTAPTAQIAKAQADAKYIRAQQATVKLNLTVIGDPTVAAGHIVEVQGLGKRLSGKYCVKNAKHKLTASGYTLDLALCTDGSHAPTAPQPNDASPNTKPLADPNALKPTVIVVNQQTGTSYRR